MPRPKTSSETQPTPPAPVSRGFDESDEFARAIFEALAEGVLVVDHRGRIVAMNTSAERLLGYTTRTLIGVDVRDSLWTIEDENGRSLDHEDWPIVTTLESGVPSGRLVVTVRPDGDRRIIVMIAMPLPRPDARRWTVVSLADVTRERRAELALASSEGRFRQLVEQAPDAVIVVDDTGTITTCNQRTTDVFGYSPDELIGAPIELLVPETSRSVHRTLRAGFIQAPTSRPMGAGADLFGRRKDGSEFPVEVSLGVMDTPEGQRHVAIARDVTERRRAQEMMVLDKAKSEFLSRMSHELRTPLNSILGFAQLLELAGPRPDQHEALEQIQQAGHHLLDLLNDLLEFERVRAGHITFSIEPVGVATVISEALHLIEPLAQSSGITAVEVDPPDRRQLWVSCDRLRLRQVLLNLLSNAVKYNHRGGRVEVATSTVGDDLMISIRDTGEGIADDMRGRLFAPFERLGSDIAVEGAGVGLALSKMLVEGMDGHILVESEPGVGSTFTIVLPGTDRPPRPDDPPNRAEHLSTDAIQRLDGLRVLCIEDNVANVRLIETMLAMFHVAESLTARTGAEGLKIALDAVPDVILLDLHLPDLSGEAVFQQLHSNRRTQSIPVIVVSADASPATARRLLSVGANRYLTKPVDVSALYEAIVTATH